MLFFQLLLPLLWHDSPNSDLSLQAWWRFFKPKKCSLFYLAFWIVYDCLEKEIYLSFRIWSRILEKYLPQKRYHLLDYMSNDPKNSHLRSKGRGMLTPHSANFRAKKTIFAISYRSVLEIESYNGYGTQWSNGTWTGMIALLISGDVEVAVGDFTMSTHRTKVVDFTVPICETT